MGVDPADMVPIKSNLNVAHTTCADCWQSQSLQVCDFNIKIQFRTGAHRRSRRSREYSTLRTFINSIVSLFLTGCSKGICPSRKIPFTNNTCFGYPLGSAEVKRPAATNVVGNTSVAIQITMFFRCKVFTDLFSYSHCFI